METITSNPERVKSREGIVSPEEWIAARTRHLAREKELTRLHEELMAERRLLPWVKIEKNYVFDGPKGKQTFADLFEGRSQLILRHFMFGPGWAEGCPGCSFAADHVDGARQHFENHDVSFVAVSRAPIEAIEAFKKRMGWRFNWVSAYRNDFNFDFHVSFPKEEVGKSKQFYNYEWQDIREEELPGTSVFYKYETGEIYHTYSTFGRGEDILVGAYNYLDLTPMGRNENGPFFNLMDWVKHHDRYEDKPLIAGLNEKDSCCASKEHQS